MEMIKNKKQDGFTLIEILVVIAILAIIAVVVFVALNPAQRFADARDSRRVTDVNSILTAIHECIVDNDGAITSCLSTNGASLVAGDVYQIVGSTTFTAPFTGCNAQCASTVTDAAHCADIDDDLVTYLAKLPQDPQVTATDQTGYTVSIDANNLVTVSACNAEGSVISASR